MRIEVLRRLAATGLLASVVVAASLVVAATASGPSPAMSEARALLHRAILPTNAMLVHPATNVVCQCAGTPGDAKYLVTTHRFYVVPGSPSTVERFLAAHVPKGGVESGEGSSGAFLSNTTAFAANGPHVYLRQLAYTTTARNATSSWLRIDSDIIWVPSRSSSQTVTNAVSASVTGYKSVALDGSSGATKVSVTGQKLVDLVGVLNSLPLGPQNSCMEDLTGFTLAITLKRGVVVQVYSGFCGGPSDVVFALAGRAKEVRYSLADTSCALVKDVVSLFGRTHVLGTSGALRSCQAWRRNPVAYR